MRRVLGRVALIGIALLGVGAIYAYRQVASIEVERVTDDVHVLFGLGGNVGVLATERGAVIVDSMTFRMQGAQHPRDRREDRRRARAGHHQHALSPGSHARESGLRRGHEGGGDAADARLPAALRRALLGGRRRRHASERDLRRSPRAQGGRQDHPAPAPRPRPHRRRSRGAVRRRPRAAHRRSVLQRSLPEHRSRSGRLGARMGRDARSRHGARFRPRDPGARAGHAIARASAPSSASCASCGASRRRLRARASRSKRR